MAKGEGHAFIPQSDGTRLPLEPLMLGVRAWSLEEDLHCAGGYQKTGACLNTPPSVRIRARQTEALRVPMFALHVAQS